MSNTTDPLLALIDEDASEVDRGKLTEVLKPYLVFDKEGTLSFLKGFDKLANDGKVQIILLASKAKHLLGLVQEEGATPKEIINMDIMPEGSVKSTLKKLLEKDRSIKKAKSGRYFIPNYRVSDIPKELSKESSKG